MPAVTLISRRYNSTDGVGSLSVVKVTCDPAQFERWRHKFRSEASKIDGGAEKMPRLKIDYSAGDGEDKNAQDLAHAFCYNHEWLAFMKYLLDAGVTVERVIDATLGSRRVSASDRNDAMTALDEQAEALIGVMSERGQFQVELLDSAGSMVFVGV